MWTIIIFAVLAYAIKFFYDNEQQKAQISSEGGMLKKYEIIINRILELDPRAKFFKVSSSSVSLGLSGGGGVFMFVLSQTFGKLSVNWVMNSPFFGKHNLSWNFPEYEDQNNMVERIFADLGKYQSHMVVESAPEIYKEETKASSIDSLMEFTKEEKNRLELSMLAKRSKEIGLEGYTKEEFEYLTKRILKKDFYAGYNMLQRYIMEFPEEKDRLNEIAERIEDEYYDSDEYLNYMMENILSDKEEVGWFVEVEQKHSDLFHESNLDIQKPINVRSISKKKFEDILSYLILENRNKKASDLIHIYKKCYPEEIERLERIDEKFENI